MKYLTLFTFVFVLFIGQTLQAQTTTQVDLSSKTVEFNWAPADSLQDSTWKAKKAAYAPLISKAYAAQGGKAAYGEQEELAFDAADKVIEIIKILDFPSPNGGGQKTTQYLVSYNDANGDLKYGFALTMPKVTKTVAQGGEISIAASWKKGD